VLAFCRVSRLQVRVGGKQTEEEEKEEEEKNGLLKEGDDS
jgi:hypothetical protein